MTDPLHPQYPLLMVDDQPAWLASFKTILAMAGVDNVETCDDPGSVLPLLENNRYSMLLMDIVMPGKRGDELLPEILERHPDLVVIMLSGLDQVDIAVGCIKAGAWDYFVKTTEPETLVAAVKRALGLVEARAENLRLRDALKDRGPRDREAFADMVTEDPVMLAAFRYMEAVAPTFLPVLIAGETGSGKELAARALHRLSGRPGRFVAVNIAGLDDNAVTDTLFGHRKGAFTDASEPREGLVARAADGTLFLDEICDLSMASQVKLLRLLQENEYMPLGGDAPMISRARVVTATQRDLAELVEQGGFRADLYYRLSAHQAHLPPLRERAGDVPLLLDHFLAQAAGELDKTRPPVSPETVKRLERYGFPGNVRELRSLVFDAMAGYQRGWLALDVPGNGGAIPAGEAEQRGDGPFAGLERLPTAAEAYDQLVREALRRTEGNRTQAAEILGVSRQALARHMKKQP